MKYYIVHIEYGYIYASFTGFSEALNAFNGYLNMCLSEENPIDCKIVESDEIQVKCPVNSGFNTLPSLHKECWGSHPDYPFPLTPA